MKVAIYTRVSTQMHTEIKTKLKLIIQKLAMFKKI